jgi:antirestriction protein
MNTDQENWAREVSEEYPHTDTAFFIYLNNHHIELTENWSDDYSDFESAYIGEFASDYDFYEYMAESLGIFSNVDEESPLVSYFDLKSWGRDLHHDYWDSDGHYFGAY